MAPPVPDKCDACSKPLSRPLVCSRCKAYAYCNTACQTRHWGEHKSGCSALPAGELVPARVEPSEVRAEEVRKVAQMLLKLNETVNAESDVIGWVSADHYEEFLNYSLPPAFASPPIPGVPAAQLATPAHKVLQLARLFLLHDLSQLSSAHARAAFAPVQPGGELAQLAAITRHAARDMLGARLHAAKVLAVPDRLSAEEYRAVLMRMAHALWDVAPEHGARRKKWAALVGVAMLVRLAPVEV